MKKRAMFNKDNDKEGYEIDGNFGTEKRNMKEKLETQE